MSTASAQPPSVAPVDHAGKYLIFGLGNESYGVPVLKVREIVHGIDITPVPRMPDHVRGVINLRGRVLPVIDLRIRFGLKNSELTATTCTIVMNVNHADGARSWLGFVVDTVEDVSRVTDEMLSPSPDFGDALTTDHIIGIVRIEGGVKTLLDMDKIVAADKGGVIGTGNDQQPDS